MTDPIMTVGEFHQLYQWTSTYRDLLNFCLKYHVMDSWIKEHMSITVHVSTDRGGRIRREEHVYKCEENDLAPIEVTSSRMFFLRLRSMAEAEALSKGILSYISIENFDREEDPDWELIFPYID